jgi:hypothetical protein
VDDAIVEREGDQTDEEIHRRLRRRAKTIDPQLLVTAACCPNKQDQIIVGWRVRRERAAQDAALGARVVLQRNGPALDPKETIGCTITASNKLRAVRS